MEGRSHGEAPERSVKCYGDLMRPKQTRLQRVRERSLSEGWGLQSVPGVFSDFQRHTSQTSLAQHAAASHKAQILYTLPAFFALPTAVQATRFLTQSSEQKITALLIPAFLLLGATTLSFLNGLSKLHCSKTVTFVTMGGLTMLALASSFVPSELVAAAVMVATQMRVLENGFSAKTMFQFVLWFSILTFHLYFDGPQSLVGVPPLLLSCWWLSQWNDRSVDPLLSLGSAFVLLVSVMFIIGPSFFLIALAIVASGAWGVFLLVCHDINVSRWNALASATVTYIASLVTGVPAHLSFALAALSVLISFTGRKGIIENSTHQTQSTSTSKWSLIDSILLHDDTRSIFYFLLLNFSFMLIQMFYSIMSHSLGLLSDSIHMFFDCLALVVGLVASILAKLPPSSRFPFGLAMVETVSGFSNGCLLVAISVQLVFEAFERLQHPVEIEKIGELLIVSVLGLLVNLFGIVAFHAGHGHGHGPGQGHGHGHSHGHEHGHDRPVKHSEYDDHHHAHGTYGHIHGHTSAVVSQESKAVLANEFPTYSHQPDSSVMNHKALPKEKMFLGSPQEYESENLHGILLHIVADILGSIGVIISTILTYYTGWAGFDPIASIVIAVVIFVSAIPLIISSARTLLLSLTDTQEYDLRDVLDELVNTKGVVSYTVPKFWGDGKHFQGSLHIQYARNANSLDVRDKVVLRLRKSGINKVAVQMEEEGSLCWCKASS